MRLGDLSRYGLSERLLRVWRERQGERLLPVQIRALRQGLLEQRSGRDNLIISAPTSSGKSFCAELAAAAELARRRKVIMLFPLKSLAEQKYRLFEETYGRLGINCLIVTGDHPGNDRIMLRNDYQLAVVIYEKLDLLLAGYMDLLKPVGLVVVDELQMIGEPGRGAVLERLLTKLKVSRYRPRLLALSAVLGGDQVRSLADWLETDLVEETRRPRDLIRGVAVDGLLRYRSFNGDCEGEQPLDEKTATGAASDDLVAHLLAQLNNSTGSTLVFLKSRSDTVDLALRLASALERPAASEALKQLSGEEPSALLRALSQALTGGVAFHNSDLSLAQRRIVETAFERGEVSLLCSTTTLALGVNLPADNVFLETVKYESGHYDSRPALVPISREEFDNMTGRAGRLIIRGRDESDRVDRSAPGKAVVLAASSFDQEVLWQMYFSPADHEAMHSAFDTLPLEDWVMHLVGSNLATGWDELHRVLAASFWFKLKGSFPAPLEPAVETLVHRGFIKTGPDRSLTATPSGRAVARTGLSVREAGVLLDQLAQHSPESPFGWTCLALSSPDWRVPPAIINSYELINNLPVKLLYQRFDHSVEEAVPLLPEEHRREPLDYRGAAALKSALLLEEWCHLTPLEQLEERYGLHLGQIQSLGRSAAHLVSALAQLVRAFDIHSPLVDRLNQHAFSLRFGLPASYDQLHDSFGSILNRSDFLNLHQGGIESFEELCDTPLENLRGLFSDESKLNKINELMESLEEEVDMQSTALNSTPRLFAQPQKLEIDGGYQADRYLVRIDGFPVRLTGKSFKYLVKLAWSRLNQESGWIYKEDIEIGFNQARYMYRMKNEIQAGFRSRWPIVENNRLGYYRLKIDPQKIQLNLDNLKGHPDYDLRKLFQQPEPGPAVN